MGWLLVSGAWPLVIAAIYNHHAGHTVSAYRLPQHWHDRPLRQGPKAKSNEMCDECLLGMYKDGKIKPCFHYRATNGSFDESILVM